MINITKSQWKWICGLELAEDIGLIVFLKQNILQK